MTRRNKLVKFTELLTFPNVYQNFELEDDFLVWKNSEKVMRRGKWATDHFKNDKPITLELACGRGEYCLGLAARHPDRNFIGVDIKGARIWKGARIALQEGLSNIAFLRTRIEFLHQYIAPGEIDEIWITFPDPFLKYSKFNRRLTSPNFLKLYHSLLQEGGLVHLKTDSDELHKHTQEVLEEQKQEIVIDNNDIYNGVLPHPDLDIPTYYERMHLRNNKTIKYVQFKVKY